MWILPIVTTAALLVAQSPRSESLTPRLERLEILAAESKALDAAAEKARAAGSLDEAAAIEAIRQPPPPADDATSFVPLPETAPAANLAEGARETDLPAEVSAILKSTAARLLDLARRCALETPAHLGIAAESLKDALRRDPDNPELRRLLGYVPYQGGWATPQAAANLEAGMVLHATFGWVPANWVAELESGKLPGQVVSGEVVSWLPAADADRLREDFFKRPWTIRTEHFEVTTNVPLSEAISFGRQLEAVHQAFFIQLADLIGPDHHPLALRFRDPRLIPTPARTLHQVWYFADASTYIKYARDRFRRDETISLGFYLEPPLSRRFRVPPRSYFHRAPDQPVSALATLFHEASHQLLFESAGPTAYTRNVDNYWVWEGLGTYFETFQPQPDGSYQIGGLTGPRIERGLEEARAGKLLLTLAEIQKLTPNQFMDEHEIYRNYIQAMAWTLFLMQAEGGRYRSGFLAYIREAYDGQFRPGGPGRSLEEHLILAEGSLDAPFRSYMGAADARPPGEATIATGPRRQPRFLATMTDSGRNGAGTECKQEARQPATTGKDFRRPGRPAGGSLADVRQQSEEPVRLMALLAVRWNAAQLPLRFRENILLWLVQSFFRRPMSL